MKGTKFSTLKLKVFILENLWTQSFPADAIFCKKNSTESNPVGVCRHSGVSSLIIYLVFS